LVLKLELSVERAESDGISEEELSKEVAMTFELRSTAFAEGEMIPAQHTCDGEDVSPPLTWDGVPDETQRLALILEDIDSVKGVWSHWVVYDMPPDVRELPESVSPTYPRPGGGLEGRNDFGNIGYGGPCPSDGKTHRYVARLYALDRRLGLAPGATRQEILESIEGHVIRTAELMGRYERLADR
jgi:Raf kinase inhibitor-like YbhB/YbcL family protein